MERKFYAIVVAGGNGLRMGSALPKQFLDLEGVPILMRSLEVFVRACPEVHLVVVLPRDHMAWWEAYCLSSNCPYPQQVVEGGITRFHSVKNALAKVPDGALVAVHDAVRPLVTADLVRRMLAGMDTARALIPVVPVVDTLKVLRRADDGDLAPVPGAAVDRSVLYAAQTPQLFRSEDLKEAYRLPYSTHFTDDASVAEAKQIPLSFIEGERLNLKITTPEDLVLARAVVTSRPRG